MSDTKTVVWSEGMFMRPQHLQQHTRYVEALVHDVHYSSSHLGWGFSELVLDRSLLSAGHLGITAARGVFQDSTPFEIAANGTVASINLANATPDDRVCLVIAARGGGSRGQEFARDNDGSQMARYVAQSIEVGDNAAELAEDEDSGPGGSNDSNAAPVMVGNLRLQLALESKVADNSLKLPVARIQDVLGDGTVRLDELFVPPVTRIAASEVLSQYGRELASVVGTRADQLARRVGDLISGAEFSLQILWLMTANRYDPVLNNLPSIDPHPVDFYQLLLGMAGELSTLHSQSKRPADLPAYDHLNASRTFGQIMDELRTIWSSRPVDMVKELPMTFAESRQTWLSKISNHNLLGNANFVLAASASITEDELATRLPEQMIVAPVEQIDDRASDLRLALAKVKPRNVPTLDRWVYFHLETGGRTWKDMASSAAFAFFVDRLEHDFPDLKLKFWAVPNG